MRFRGGRAALLVMGVCALSACASLSPSTPSASVQAGQDGFALEGRFSLRHDDKNVSGRIAWRHAGSSSAVFLSSPFGQGVAEILTDASGARLTTAEGKTFTAPDVETLTRDVLGYALPLGLLSEWVRGRVGGREGAAEFVERDAQGRPLRVRHADWALSFDYGVGSGGASDVFAARPERIVAAHVSGIELRLRIDQWVAP